MSAMDTLLAARRMWEQQDQQLTLEDPALAGDYGTPELATLQARTPGPDTHLAASTNGSPPRAYGCHVPACEERDADQFAPTTRAAPATFPEVRAGAAGGEFNDV